MLFDNVLFVTCVVRIELIIDAFTIVTPQANWTGGLSEARSDDVSLNQVAEFPTARRIKCRTMRERLRKTPRLYADRQYEN